MMMSYLIPFCCCCKELMLVLWGTCVHQTLYNHRKHLIIHGKTTDIDRDHLPFLHIIWPAVFGQQFLVRPSISRSLDA